VPQEVTAIADVVQLVPAIQHSEVPATRSNELIVAPCLQVTNLHVRYEDSVTRPGSTFACGVTLHSMGAFTVDEAGKEMFVKKAAMALLRKAADLSRFSMYFDTGAAIVCRGTAV
jgi:Vacuolar sorting-associated protein 13, N-terminal